MLKREEGQTHQTEKCLTYDVSSIEVSVSDQMITNKLRMLVINVPHMQY